MKHFLLIATLTLAPAFAQEPEAAKQSEVAKAEKKEETGDSIEIWKWANFVILAGGLGYLAVKGLGAMFKTKSAEIRKGIDEAQQIKKDAEARARAIDARVSALGTEVEKIRAESVAEMQNEGDRIRQDTAAAIAKLEHQAAAEIETAGKAARRELKEYGANLAVNLAEQRIQARMDASTEGVIIDNFIADLTRQGSKN